MTLLRELISHRLGVQVRNQDTERLHRTLTERSKLLKLAGLDEYAQFLQKKSFPSDREWQELATLLTTGETFFFRDQGQIHLLKNQILPELIELRRQQRSLRIWSAGCASGEEPYSLAILLDELLSEQRGWDIYLLGTDINVAALEKARRATYTEWSFRKVDPDAQQKYFRQHGRDWQLDARIKNKVTFQPLNLLTDVVPNATAREMDLIICRNVFIYFSAEHVASIVHKFAATLRSGGYLLTGHGELQGQNPDPLETRVFSESVAYQRSDSRAADVPTTKPFVSSRRTATQREQSTSEAGSRQPTVLPSGSSAKQEPPVKTGTADGALDGVEELLRQGHRATALEKAERRVRENPRDARAHCLLAQAHADLGDHKEAVKSCQAAVDVDPFTAAPLYLLAHISEAEGCREDAESYLKKVIYLDPSHIAARLDLAALLERDGDTNQARKVQLAVIDLLKSLPRDERIEFHGQLTAGQLTGQLEQMVTNG